MNMKDKELAVKIFNHFFEKCGISKLFIFPRSSYSFDFGLNCIINNTEYFLTFNISALASTFIAKHKAMKIGTSISRNGVIEVNELSTSISQWPVSLKIAVIEECLKRNTNLYAVPVSEDLDMNVKDTGMNVIVVPVAKSLEELAIKMELET